MMRKYYILLLMVFTLVACKDDVEPVYEEPANETAIPKVYINEVVSVSSGAGEDWDWIEIHNAESTEADISGYRLYDKPEDTFLIPQGTVIAPGGFVVFEQRKNPQIDGYFEFGLSSSGDEVFLTSSSGVVVDHISFSAMSANESYGRMTDADSTKVYFTQRSKKNSNKGMPQRK